MTASNQVVPYWRDSERKKLPQADRTQRPSFRWSDIWRAPLHDYPIRDEILYQYLPLSPEMAILEIGPGSGYTAYRLARQVRQLTLVEVAPEAMAELRVQLGHVPRLRLVCADVTQPGLARRFEQEFDAVFGLDVFEYLADPATCLKNLAEVLRPSGELFLTYPNVPPPAGDGVTYFSQMNELENLLADAGFRRWQIFGVRLRPHAATIYSLLHEWPLQLYRKLRGGHEGRPQTYEVTWAFQHRHELLRYKVPLHLFWLVLGLGLRLGGAVFAPQAVTDGILGQQLVIRAWR